MEISAAGAAKQIKNANRILILTHHNPDGDTLRSAFACKGRSIVLKSNRLCCVPTRFQRSFLISRKNRELDFSRI